MVLLQVRQKIIHPKFQYRITQPDRYDLALLELKTETEYSYHILPICLPEENLNLYGKKAIIAGWGKIKSSADTLGTNILRSATVIVLGKML